VTEQLSWWLGWILLYKSRHLVLKLGTNLIFWLKLWKQFFLNNFIKFSMNFIIFKNNFINMTCSIIIMLQFLSIINLPCYEGLISFSMSNRCLTTGEQFFNYSCYIAWLEHITDDNVSPILEHHTVLNFYNAVSLQNTPQIDMSLHSDPEPISLYSHSSTE
jgi:hypothetical protein